MIKWNGTVNNKSAAYNLFQEDPCGFTAALEGVM